MMWRFRRNGEKKTNPFSCCLTAVLWVPFKIQYIYENEKCKLNYAFYGIANCIEKHIILVHKKRMWQKAHCSLFYEISWVQNDCILAFCCNFFLKILKMNYTWNRVTFIQRHHDGVASREYIKTFFCTCNCILSSIPVSI